MPKKHNHPSGCILAWAEWRLTACRNQLYQIEKNQCVDHQQAHSGHCQSAKYLEDLPGQEGGGDGQCQVLGPYFFQIQADSLDQIEAGINEYDCPDTPKQPVIEDRHPVEDEVDETRLRVEAQMVGQIGKNIADILVQQPQRAHSNGGKEERLRQLEGSDEDEPSIAAPRLR